MIYPSAKAVILAAAAAVPAFAIAVAVPNFWYAGLIGVVLVLAFTIADALAAVPLPKLPAQVAAPPGACVGETVTVAVSVPIFRQRFEARIGHDERLRPLTAEARLVQGVRQANFEAVRRGVATIDMLWLRWAGPFGLVWRQHKQPMESGVVITPDIRPARAEALRLFRRDVAVGETVQLEAGAGAEFQALAEFRQGMDRRAVDWKRSAHHGKLIAKEYRIERNNDIVFAIDGGRLMSEPVGGLPKVDRAVSAALSAAFVALKLGDKVSVFSFDSRPRLASGPLGGANAFAVVQRLAARIDYSTEETNHSFALTTLGARLVRRSLVLMFTDFADPTSAALMLRRVQTLAQKHLVLFVLMRDVELDGLVAAEPVRAADVSRAVVAASLLRERKIVVARLLRMGVHVVEAPYERLSTELVNAYLDLKKRDLL